MSYDPIRVSSLEDLESFWLAHSGLIIEFHTEHNYI